ncbi:TetR/AcrR family transcriptional regulator [Saccharothrix syringae]|uniref:TetR/AcrR family transcriptional regulator n=1 Tax=Saccharothrix syringae TaxID=103733 RepID=A0A5Q0H0V3_SACSY|nr:TetR/AcrR family transcriptional regulator [Saccharothrix syringae]QFZ19525.1 TetR/AcrR family transcriptional regulator [Saccharothrix syringae]
MDHDEAATRVLDAAEALFYERGVQAVGMDAVRAASGVSLKRLYRCFPSKDHLVAEYLRRRDLRWRESLASFVAQRSAEPVAAVFDWLHRWFAEPGFRGCAFINSFGELGADSPVVADLVRHHKDELRRYLAGLLPADSPDAAAEQLLLLVEGAIVTASITGDPTVAHRAGAAAEVLMTSACRLTAPG